MLYIYVPVGRLRYQDIPQHRQVKGDLVSGYSRLTRFSLTRSCLLGYLSTSTCSILI